MRKGANRKIVNASLRIIMGSIKANSTRGFKMRPAINDFHGGTAIIDTHVVEQNQICANLEHFG